MELKTKIYLLDEEGEKFMGMGVLWLLQAIEKTKSLRSAVDLMHISYSKAYNMINNLEKALGKDIIDRKKGGVERSGSQLTPFGIAFTHLYDEFQQRAKAMLEAPYATFSKELVKLMEE